MQHRSDQIHILSASRLVEEKWVDILIDAIEYISSRSDVRDRVFWTICSDGLREPEIRTLVQKYPKRVSYRGKISSSELRKLYMSHDFLFMPSRFLETFGLTALEALSVGTPVIGFRKGGLIPFIPESLVLDPTDPIGSLIDIIQSFIETRSRELTDVSDFSLESWRSRMLELLWPSERVLLIHDYSDLIGGAEYYLNFVQKELRSSWKQAEIFAYTWKTTPWKRRWMFIASIFAYSRGRELRRVLNTEKPDGIWMHSILRYIGPWGVRAVKQYVEKYPNTQVYLSHHDLGLIAAFPQSITEESQIPLGRGIFAFIPRELSLFRMIMSIGKWCYKEIVLSLLAKSTKHIIFSPFLEKHIQNHFPASETLLFPHTIQD